MPPKSLAGLELSTPSLQGSVGGGYQYTTSTSTTTEEGFSTAISASGYWAAFTSTKYTSDIASHVPSSGTTWNTFVSAHGSASAVVADYITDALVSSDFKT